MSTDRDSYKSLQAEYTAAVAQERAEWKVASDASLGAVERVLAYARWLAAAERVKALSIRLGDHAPPAWPCRP
ncbi:MAG TPA: hypothetical protein VGA59_04230 [Ramlibacter sp.]|jgi:hypothetical protein